MLLKKKYIKFRPRIRSRHPSHDILRSINKTLPLLPFKSLIRFGSNTELNDTINKGGNRIELNNVESIQNSSNKLLMKNCFAEDDILTADWWQFSSDGFINNSIAGESPINNINDLPYPIISKNIYGSRGKGNKKHDTAESLQEFINSKSNLDNYIFEKYYNYYREYRLHVTKEGCFYSCRKMLKNDAPKDVRWFRNDANCVWIMEENELFDKPSNWKDVINESVKALNAVGLDFGAIDLRIQSSTNKKNEKREYPKFIIVEINSAPSFGDITTKKYIEELPKLLTNKYNEKT